MSIVSAKIDDSAMFRKKIRPIAVQYDRNDSGSAEPPDFAFPMQIPTTRMIQGSMRAVDGCMPHGEYVPLRKHLPEGSADFWAGVPFAVPSLNIERDAPVPFNTENNYSIAKYQGISGVQEFYPYQKGIREGSRPVVISEINEPTAMFFRKGQNRKLGYAPSSINYDLGMEELREMYQRY
jgi:hypothetical protein